MLVSNQRYTLEPYKSNNRFTCPQCGHKREFTRYVDQATGNYLADHVGRCNRESSCGYHLKPSEWFKTDGSSYNASTIDFKPAKIEEQPVSYIDEGLFKRSFNELENTSFAQYLNTLFGYEIASNLFYTYMLGRSRADNGTAVIFWRVDNDLNIRTGKVVCYDATTGKRKKGETDPKPYFIHSKLNGNYKQCFFGEHLLKLHPDKPCAIVESEKTAVIMSVYMPQFNWLATGGASGCKWSEASVYSVLKGRKVLFFPDHGYYSRPASKPQSEWITCFDKWTERVKAISAVMPGTFVVSRELEDTYSEEDRMKDLDLVDHLVRTDETGRAMTDENYPLMWDISLSDVRV